MRRPRVGWWVIGLAGAVLAAGACGAGGVGGSAHGPGDSIAGGMQRPRGHTDFARAFTPGALFFDPDEHDTYRTEVFDLGELDLHSGHVIVADPGYFDSIGGSHDLAKPLPREVPIGRWPAQLAVADRLRQPGDPEPVPLGGDGTTRPTGPNVTRGSVPPDVSFGTVAAMRVRFSGTTVDWVPAIELDGGYVGSAGVDSGTMAIGDAEDIERFHDRDEFAAELDQLMQTETDPGSLHLMPLASGGSLFFSQAGKGDGGYPIWWGVGADGAVTELVVEFDVLIRNTFTEVDLRLADLPGEGRVESPALDALGLALEVVGADDVGGAWDMDVPRGLPDDAKKAYEKPDIARAVRITGRRAFQADVELIDAGGERVHASSGRGIGDDTKATFYWVRNDELARADRLRVQVFEGFEGFGPPPG